MYIEVQRRTIMNKFRRFLGRISAETCLKMNYFGSISPKTPNAGSLLPDARLDSMNKECAKTLLPLNISDWCRCLAILEQNETLWFLFFDPLPVQKSCLHHWEGWYLSTMQTNSAFFKKKLEYCSQHNALHYECYHCQTKLFSPNIYLSFAKFSYRQKMFWSKNLSPNMPKITSFLLKNSKNRPALEALPPDPLCLQRLGAQLHLVTKSSLRA